MNQNISSFPQLSNNSFLFSPGTNSSSENNNLTFNIKAFKPKKRNYNELMESYKQNHRNAFLSETEELHKSLNMRYRKTFENTNFFIKEDGKNFIKNHKKTSANNFPQISHQKKILNLDTKKKFVNEEDDIDLIEKDFNVCERKYDLSKSYLFDECAGFYSDLDDTKENSFLSLNVSFDYPELNLDVHIKDKLISNALELEKTFNRIFNVKNMPNKK